MRSEGLSFYGSFSFTSRDAVYLCGQPPAASAKLEDSQFDAQDMGLSIKKINQARVWACPAAILQSAGVNAR